MSDDERNELADLQRAHSELGHARQELIDWRKDYTRLMTAINALQGALGKRINELKLSRKKSSPTMP